VTQRERWTNEAFLLLPEGLHRLAISLDDAEAQAKTLSESLGGESVARDLGDGLLWLRADREGLDANELASLLADEEIRGPAVFTGVYGEGVGLAPLDHLAVWRLWECVKRLPDDAFG